ncbi:hypothetical protein FVR03_22580 [Pontibacter qinzhouensis]|uniref:Lipoprotein n=1 Tax=Pontibacter qinzhouensis TaxID=2603253 RepID=A0A5C8IRC7_9BACT|nr:hypothetical protein [Pontibacter qinzhouensis]TXK23465.1 hypothetical protein FVR03_22580 [Pontibacter qinzhouensis]
MKKTLYSICCASALLFASCTEDRGTTAEVADANENEQVNQNHLNTSENQTIASTGGFEANTEEAHLERSQEISSKMAADLKLDKTTKEKVASIFYERDKMLGDIDESYNVSATNRMGGQAEAEVDGSATAPTQNNNAGNMPEANENNAELTQMRSTIIEDADKDLRAALTAEQFKKFEDNRSNYDHVSHKSEASSVSDDKIKTKDIGDKTEVKPRN